MTTTAQQDEVNRAVPVTRHALIQRINRALGPDQQALRVTRDRWRGDLGTYYTVDFNRNTILQRHVDPEAFARELGVLRSWERVR